MNLQEAFATMLTRAAYGDDVSLSDVMSLAEKFRANHEQVTGAVRLGVREGWFVVKSGLTGLIVSNDHQLEETIRNMSELYERATDDGMVFDFYVSNTALGDDRAKSLRRQDFSGYTWAQEAINWDWKY